MYKRWPKTVPEGLEMELRGKKDRRHVRTHKREEKSRVRLCPSVSLTPENGGMFGNASLGQGSGNEWVLNRGWAVCTCDGFSREKKKKRNFAKRLRCPQLFKLTLSKWNGMEWKLLLNGKKKKVEFYFPKELTSMDLHHQGRGRWQEWGGSHSELWPSFLITQKVNSMSPPI